MTAKFEYYVGKYGAGVGNFDAARWGIRLFLGATLFALAVMFFFWTWQAPSTNSTPTMLVQTEAPVVTDSTLDVPAELPAVPLKVLVPGTTDVYVCINNADVDKFNRDSIYNGLILKTVAYHYSLYGREVSTSCD